MDTSEMLHQGGTAAATDAGALTAAIADRTDLAARQFEGDRLLAAEGAGHIVNDLPLRSDGRMVTLESRPWRIDPIPLVIDSAEFVALADGAVARMQMLEAIVGDLYGARTLLADAVIDPAALWSSERYRLAAYGNRPVKRWLTNYALDVARTADGRWHVIRDLTDTPSGVGYSLLGRTITSRVHRDIIARLPAGSALRSLDPFADRLRDGLADVASTPSPRIVVLSGGVDHSSFVEQSYLATRLGLNLAEGADLVVRQRRVWLRSLAGLEPVDVLFRRLEDDRIDPMEVNASGSAGVPGLLLATRSRGVSLANAHGTGVFQEPRLAEQWDAAGTWLTAHGSDYQGAAPLQMMPHGEQATARWATAPCFDGINRVQRAVTMRLHLVATDVGINVLQGGSARVLREGDEPSKPTAATAKDVWVIGGTVAPPAVWRRQPLPRVDLIASVPTRAAEALFWAGRAMERAELLTRAMHVLLDRTSGAVDAEVAEDWVGPGLTMLASIAGTAPPTNTGGGTADHSVAFGFAIDALANQLGSFLAEVSSVREFFSGSAGRSFARIAEARARLRTLVPVGTAATGALDVNLIDAQDLETTLIDLASIVGLWNESVLHGPAWRYGEIGRRLERTFGVIDAMRGAFMTREGADGPEAAWLGAVDDQHRLDFQRQRVIELVLATNESLVAYRRRHRSDVEFQLAAHLVVSDTQNPRSAAAAVRAVHRQAERLDWQFGIDVAGELAGLVEGADCETIPETATLLISAWDACDRLARDVVGSHLAPPVDPRMMGRG